MQNILGEFQNITPYIFEEEKLNDGNGNNYYNNDNDCRLINSFDVD